MPENFTTFFPTTSSMISLFVTLASHTFVYTIGSLISRVITFLFLPYLLRYITLEDVGTWDLYQMIFSTLGMFLTSCTITPLIRFYHDTAHKEDKSFILGTTLEIMLIVSSIIFLSCCILFHYLSWAYFITILNSILYTYFSFLFTQFRLTNKLFLYLATVIAQNTLATLGMLIGVCNGYGINSFFLATTFSYAMFVPFLFSSLRSYVGKSKNISSYSSFMHYGLPLAAYSFLYSLFFISDRTFLYQKCGCAAVGVYGILWRFGMLFQIFSIALMDALLLMFFNVQDFTSRKHIFKLCLYSLIIMSLLILAFSYCAIMWFLPSTYHEANNYLSIFFIWLTLLEIARMTQISFNIIRNTKIILLGGIITFLIQLIFIYGMQNLKLTAVMISNVITFSLYIIINYCNTKMLKAPLFYSVYLYIHVIGTLVFYAFGLQILFFVFKNIFLSGLFLSTLPFWLWKSALEGQEKKLLHEKLIDVCSPSLFFNRFTKSKIRKDPANK